MMTDRSIFRIISYIITGIQIRYRTELDKKKQCGRRYLYRREITALVGGAGNMVVPPKRYRRIALPPKKYRHILVLPLPPKIYRQL